MDVWSRERDGFKQADYLCASELVYGLYTDDAKVLPYGSVLKVNGLTCSSAQSGVKCVHDASGHGFRIASGSNELF